MLERLKIRLRSLSLKRWTGWIGPLLIALGVLLLGYVISQYASMFMEQRRLAHLWQEQNSPAAATAAAPRPADDGLTRLSIPRINLDAVVTEGSSRRQLAIAPGHMTESPIPGLAGNSVITAHRDTFFRHIYELQRGDSILVQRSGEQYRFEVIGKKVVAPDDVSVLKPTKDPHLTLVTCYPTYFIGPAPERLVVFSKLVDHAPANVAKAAVKSGGVQ